MHRDKAMKTAASEPEHLRDALASLPEPLDLEFLVLPDNGWRRQDDFLKPPLERLITASDPLSQRLR